MLQYLALTILAAAAVIGPPLARARATLPRPGPDQITFHAEQSYPESFSWSARQRAFFVGSLRNGTIGKVSLTGNYQPFASDPAMFGSGGVKYDARRNWIWAALCDIGIAARSSSDTQGKIAAIIAFDADTGKKQRFIDLAHLAPGAHCANDLAFDPEGNIYVTDSFAPVVYVVDRHFTPRILVRSEQFQGENFNLNGVVFHPQGFLLVGKHNTGELFRIRLAPRVDVQAVALSVAVPGADGIELLDRNALVLAQNGGHDRAVRLTSADGWNTATVQEVARSATTFPTALTSRGEEVYMLNNRVDTQLDPAAAKVSDYVLQRLPAAHGGQEKPN